MRMVTEEKWRKILFPIPTLLRWGSGGRNWGKYICPSLSTLHWPHLRWGGRNQFLQSLISPFSPSCHEVGVRGWDNVWNKSQWVFFILPPHPLLVQWDKIGCQWRKTNPLTLNSPSTPTWDIFPHTSHYPLSGENEKNNTSIIVFPLSPYPI